MRRRASSRARARRAHSGISAPGRPPPHRGRGLSHMQGGHAPALVSLASDVTSRSSNLWAERHDDAKIVPMTFPVTEHVLRTERHTTFYLACGAEPAPLIVFVHGWPELVRVDRTAHPSPG